MEAFANKVRQRDSCWLSAQCSVRPFHRLRVNGSFPSTAIGVVTSYLGTIHLSEANCLYWCTLIPVTTTSTNTCITRLYS
ncbi:hypothetical protein J6590_062330 [Homalodisca vitripennis]|nr:hypothetical protein J6590_062330 [Homalodisca vitripennis]